VNVRVKRGSRASEEGKRILVGYIEMKNKITKNQDLIVSLGKALNSLNIV
jgi:hypothetical protein